MRKFESDADGKKVPLLSGQRTSGEGNRRLAEDLIARIPGVQQLPDNLKRRLATDMTDLERARYQRLEDIDDVAVRKANTGYWGWKLGGLGHLTMMIQAGKVGLLKEKENFFFLAAGYHRYAEFGREYLGEVDLNVIDKPVKNGPTGFVTISEGKIGVMCLGSDFKLLAPGSYQWDSPIVNKVEIVDIQQNIAKLGPYTLVTVPEGEVAVTYDNGVLKILDGSHSTETRADASRTYFLDNPKWEASCFLSNRTQTDRLEGNDLLSKDNVELLMVAMSEWRIVDPLLAMRKCGSDMKNIRTKVNQLVRATIARIVAGTNIGAGPVSGGVAQPVVTALRVDETSAAAGNQSAGDNDLSHLMQSEQATLHMAELTRNMSAMGIQVIGVYVPEKQMKNADTRQAVAKQAVIGIHAEAERAAADAKAYATIANADAMQKAEILAAKGDAEAELLRAEAKAEAIRMVAQAQSEAGEKLGAPQTTAARLALTEQAGKSLQGAKVTFWGERASNIGGMLVSTESVEDQKLGAANEAQAQGLRQAV